MQKGLLSEPALAVLLWSSSARAQAPPAAAEAIPPTATAAPSALPVSPPEAVPQTHWYGWQTLLVDGASLGVAIGGLATRPPHQGGESYCSATDLVCGKDTVRTPHPAELFGDDWDSVENEVEVPAEKTHLRVVGSTP